VRVLVETPATNGQGGSRWSDLRLRVLSATILAPAALLCIWAGGAAYKIMLIAGALGLASEWVAMCRVPAFGMPGFVASASIVAGTAVAAFGPIGVGLAIFAIGAAAVVLLASRAPHRWALACGVPYAGIGAVALLWLRDDVVVGLADLLFLLLSVWASDIGAYMAGRLLGGPKLAPRISPGKTWSGALGGLAAAVAAGLLVAAVTLGSAQPLRVAAIAALLGIVAQAGDLLESILKRHFGVKDSGRLIPGHGGLLDRVDALLTAAPVAALLALAAGRGVVLWQ